MSDGWNDNTENLLINWSKQISINEVEHRKIGKQLYYAYIFIGIFIVIAQSGVLTGLFSAIASPNPSRTVIIILAVIQTFITIVQGVNQFFNTGAGSEKHYKAALDYKSLGEFIDSTVNLPVNKRGSAKDFLDAIRKEFRYIRRSNPPLPHNRVIHQLDMNIYQRPQDAIKERQKDFDSIPDCSSDEQSMVRAGIQEKRCQTSIDKGPLKHLEYQWERMQQFDEDV